MEQGISALFGTLPTLAAIVLLAITAVLSYLLGCLNGAVLVSKYILQDDVRAHGSGNAGLTNFYRTFGGKLTLAVIGADVMKMLLAVFFSRVLFSLAMPELPIFVTYWSGLACMLGHMFPVMFQFRGGKGILSGGTLAFLFDWRIAVISWGIFLLIAMVTRFISLGSCCAGASIPVLSILVYQSPSVLILAMIIAGLILWQHRGNLVRLVSRQESKFYFSRKQVK